MDLTVIILAGGVGTRMKSQSPKVLHRLAGKRLLEHVLDSVKQLNSKEIFVVYGHGGEEVKQAMSHENVQWVFQEKRLGTGHAVQQVLPHLDTSHKVLILYGDVPLISVGTLKHLVSSTGKSQLGLLTVEVQNPTGLGRIIRDQYHQVAEIVEEKDATDLQRQIREINTGIYCVSGKLLAEWLPLLDNKNAQGEYYLTDIVRFAKQDEVSINVSAPTKVEEIYGVNNRVELAKLEGIYRSWQAQKLMEAGITLTDPTRVDVRGHVSAGQDCIVDINVLFEGQVKLGRNCYVGPHVILKNVDIGDNVHIHPYTLIENAVVQHNVVIGPFARIRPDTVLKSDAHIGNFVEIKKSTVGEGSKINHLSYIGDATIGSNVNIGAGVITCNYDGAHKHGTVIESEVHIGSDTQLVAPVRVGKGATIGAGSTIVEDVPPGGLTVTAQLKQRHISDWKRPVKQRD